MLISQLSLFSAFFPGPTTLRSRSRAAATRASFLLGGLRRRRSSGWRRRGRYCGHQTWAERRQVGTIFWISIFRGNTCSWHVYGILLCYWTIFLWPSNIGGNQNQSKVKFFHLFFGERNSRKCSFLLRLCILTPYCSRKIIWREKE